MGWEAPNHTGKRIVTTAIEGSTKEKKEAERRKRTEGKRKYPGDSDCFGDFYQGGLGKMLSNISEAN